MASRVSTLPRIGDDVEPHAEGVQLRCPPGRTGADAGAVGQLAEGQPVAGDEHVARVAADRHGSHLDAVVRRRSAGPCRSGRRRRSRR